MSKIWHKVVNETMPDSQLSVESCKTRTDLIILVSWESRRLGLPKTFVLTSFFNTKFFIHWKKSYLSTLSLWTWRRSRWRRRDLSSASSSIEDMFSDVLRAENERSHVATETGMLKQDFSAINVSLNNSWVTGGSEIRVLAMMDVVSVRCLMSLN